MGDEGGDIVDLAPGPGPSQVSAPVISPENEKRQQDVDSSQKHFAVKITAPVKVSAKMMSNLISRAKV